jgi:hypothetical protein
MDVYGGSVPGDIKSSNVCRCRQSIHRLCFPFCTALCSLLVAYRFVCGGSFCVVKSIRCHIRVVDMVGSSPWDVLYLHNIHCPTWGMRQTSMCPLCTIPKKSFNFSYRVLLATVTIPPNFDPGGITISRLPYLLNLGAIGSAI